MRPGLRHALVYAPLALGAALLAVAAIDWSAYVFAGVDLIAYERRLYSSYGFHDTYRSFAYDALVRRMLVCTGYALLAALAAGVLARFRRPARLLLLLAVAGTLTIVALTLSATWQFHDSLARHPVVVDPDTGLRVLERTGVGNLRWQWLEIQALGACLATLLLPALAFAAVHLARQRGAPRARACLTATALALPATLAAATLTLLWCQYGEMRSATHDHWTDLIEAARLAPPLVALLVTIASVVLTRDLPRPSIARHLLALGLLALGLAAFTATAPHRRTIDTLYPLRDPGAAPLFWQPFFTPLNIDAPRTDRCVAHDFSRYEVYVYLDEHSAPTLSIGGRYAPLHDEPAVAGLLAALTASLTRLLEPPSPVVLFIDRRVPLSTLVPVLARLPSLEISPILVAGMYHQTMPSADGPVLAATTCVFAQIPFTVFADPTLPTDATWATIVDDPARRGPVTRRPGQ